MKTPRKFAIATAIATLIGVSVAGFSQPMHGASPQDASPPMAGHSAVGNESSQMPGMMQQHGPGMMDMHARHAAQMGGFNFQMPGQDAFGAIQEVVVKLNADPKTDWSKVNLEALRQHLIDMNEVTLKAEATARPVTGGLEIAVVGSGRTLAAIQAMLPAHAQEINGLNGWIAKSEAIPSGVLLTVTSENAKEVQHIRGLGFIGILVSGSHHQLHHLAMAKGDFPHGP